MSFVRTVRGDVDTSDLGFCYAHEHLIIDGPYVNAKFPEFVLDSVELAVQELHGVYDAGVRAMVDSMPTDAGRDARKLAELSWETGIHIVGPTGLHLSIYYEPGHWSETIDDEALTKRFVTEIEEGMVDGGVQTGVRAGVIKVAGGHTKLSEYEQRNFRAAGRAQAQTGSPILTHTEQGTAALEQVGILTSSGATTDHIVLSHLDRNPDVGYHREVLSTGVGLEFDSAFRWGDRQNQTLNLIHQLFPDFPDQIVLGMDAARRSYWKVYGGKPGMAFLATEFRKTLLDVGLSETDLERIFIRNPSQYYSFKRNQDV